MKRPKIHLQEVTRSQATEWLKRADQQHQTNQRYQRSMSSGIAKRYATDMNSGAWQSYIAVVAFDTRDRLINGQHVLNALLESKLQKIGVIVARGYPSEAFAGFDKNRKRSAGDDLMVKGVDRATLVAGVARVIWQYERGHFNGDGYLAARSSGQFPTAAEVVRTVETHPGIHQHLHVSPFRGKEIAVGALRAASYILHQHDPERAPKFIASLLQGIDIPSRDHPVAALRDSIMKLGKHERWRNGETLARIFAAWNLYVRRQRTSGPLLKKNQKFPQIGAAPEPPEAPEHGRVQ